MSNARLLPPALLLTAALLAAVCGWGQGTVAQENPPRDEAAPKAAAGNRLRPDAKRAEDKKGKKGKKDQDAEVEPELKVGVARWPELTEEEQQGAVKEQKEHLEEVKKLFPALRFTFAETDYFLFLSDLRQQDLRIYVPHLDNMYKRLVSFFGYKAGTNIWRGKAIVIIFGEARGHAAWVIVGEDCGDHPWI